MKSLTFLKLNELDRGTTIGLVNLNSLQSYLIVYSIKNFKYKINRKSSVKNIHNIKVM